MTNKNDEIPQYKKPVLELIYSLEVKIPEQSPRKYEVTGRLLAGLDPRNDLILIDPKIKAKHFLFSTRDAVLTLNYLGRDGDTLLNGLPLEKDRLYLLEKGDKLKTGRIQITIRAEMGYPKEMPVENAIRTSLTEESFDEESTNEKALENLKIDEIISEKKEEIPLPHILIKPEKKIIEKKETDPIQKYPRNFFLIPYKVYAFIVDIAFTYFILSYVLPVIGFEKKFQHILFPISEFLIQYSNLHFSINQLGSLAILSLIEFFVCFHLFIVSFSLLTGTTPGDFLVGLKFKPKRNFLANRFIAYLYALLNIILLPLLVFDIPFYKGQNFKEVILFRHRELSHSPFFRISRKAILPILILSSMFSPFLLPDPFNSAVTNEQTVRPKYRDTHTNQLNSNSTLLGISLKNDLNKQYALLPYFEKNKIGLIFYDLKNHNSLEVSEYARIKNPQLLFKLRYSNPISSFTIPNNQIENESLKNKSIKSLNLTLLSLKKGFVDFGPFMANGFLFKEIFLDKGLQNFTLNTFESKNPVLKLSSDKTNTHKIFIFTKNELIEMHLEHRNQALNKAKIMDDFVSQVLAPMRFNQSSSDGLNSLQGQKDPQLLEVLDAFVLKDGQTLLTYYIKEAKKAHDLGDLKWNEFLVKNIEQTKNAFFTDELSTQSNPRSRKNIKQSFEDILKTL